MWRAVPLHRLGIILWNALAAFVHDAEVVLSRGITLLGRPVPFHRLGIVLRDPLTIAVHEAEEMLSPDVTCFCSAFAILRRLPLSSGRWLKHPGKDC